MKKGITCILLILWMAVIFSFSAQNGTQSSGISRSVGYGIAEKGNRLFHQEKSEEKIAKQVEAMQFVIRKGAHMSEYALLAVLALLHICCYEKRPRRFWLWAWGFCIAFAATDEFHQRFVPGREGRVMDVCIDAIGSLIGVLIFVMCDRKFWSRKEKKNVENHH